MHILCEDTLDGITHLVAHTILICIILVMGQGKTFTEGFGTRGYGFESGCC
jgi:hypothetical protein